MSPEVRIEIDGKEIVIPIPRSGVTVRVSHQSEEQVPGNGVKLRVRLYDIFLREKGVHLQAA